MKINIKYILVFLLLLGAEVYIALYVRDAFVRPYLGDSIAIALVYALLMGFTKPTSSFKLKLKVASISLLIGVIVEALQATPFLEVTGLDTVRWVHIILGSSFSWIDMLAYLGGFVAIILIEWIIEYKKS